ncbi:MAG: peptidoglycan DD-metalloendopeptidase family protein [Patescibacteria group bacterium]
MRQKQRAKTILIEVLIPLLKSLIFIKKAISAFFVFVIFKPLIFISKSILYKPLVKIYGYYILLLKRIREVNLKNNSKFFLVKRFLTPIIIAGISFSIIISNLTNQQNFGDQTDKMYKATASNLAQNEFNTLAPEELITESAGSEATCTTTRAQYVSSDAIKPERKITTNTVPVDDSSRTSCLTQGGEAIIKPSAIATEGGQVERNSITEYTVKAGDTVSTIAREFGISVNTILWANNLTAYSFIRQGDKLSILPTSGVIHKVASGESLQKIADKYDVSKDKIILANSLESNSQLQIGQMIIVPDGKKISSVIAAKPKSSSSYLPSIVKNLVKPNSAKPAGNKMQWPTVGYRITQYYSWRHTGLDIANKVGTPLYAADAGVVEKAGWNSGGYGYMVLINHGGGIKTRYAHASKLYVKAGDKVSKGEAVAAMGSTGRSTGPHIHFEVIINGRLLNPLNYIK